MSHVATATQTVRVLFVDDDANILSSASSLLDALGNQVVTAQTRAEAEDRLRKGHYDVLMTDLTMPECTGWDLAKRSKELYPTKPVILVTGWGLALDADIQRSGLVNGFLAKPFTMDELQRALNQVGYA